MARRLAVVGAGNMGSGIAQKMAAEGFAVTLIDVNEASVARGLDRIQTTLAEGVGRGILTVDQAADIASRIHGTSHFQDVAAVSLVVEAVFEDLDVKREVFRRLDEVCRADAILATNTSSFLVNDLAAVTRRPERVLGLHYFYHPAKNRLVEVIRGPQTHAAVAQRAWLLQEALGKTPIASRDSYGFIVNRFFVPWLMHAVRLVEEGAADAATIEAATKRSLGIGMGPFELMNVTGPLIALHAATTLGRAFGPFYEPPLRLRRQVEAGEPWALAGDPNPEQFASVNDRLSAVVFFIAAALLDEGVGSLEDIDIGARVGLRWRRGPFELMNQRGVAPAAALVADLADRWRLRVPAPLEAQRRQAQPFVTRVVSIELAGHIATLKINRPDVMNALNESVLAQLSEAFRWAAADPQVKGIVIAASGKAFVAGADVRYFVRHLEAGALDQIVRFTRAWQELLRSIEACPKPVVARVHGPALGGGVELALACHAIAATPKATFAFPETGIGIYPGLGGTQRTTRRIGLGLAKWLVLTGETIDAREALTIGLIDHVVDHERLDETIFDLIEEGDVRARPSRIIPEEYRALAHLFGRHDPDSLREGQVDASGDPRLARAVRRLSSKAPLALRLAADLIEQGADLPLEAALELEMDHLEEIFSTKDAYEGLSSLGKRKPVFVGQ